ncbi:hypothetical protein GGX14DRAFT_382301, partial [Mycena pura]
SKVRASLPRKMARWSRVRIVDGDRIRAAYTPAEEADGLRDNTFVRVQGEWRWLQTLGYGRLDEILECRLPSDDSLRAYSGQLRLLAVITPCSTVGRDATQNIVSYTQTNRQIVVDLAGVMAAVGRFQSRGKWFIVDRTGGFVKPEFIPHADHDA